MKKKQPAVCRLLFFICGFSNDFYAFSLRVSFFIQLYLRKWMKVGRPLNIWSDWITTTTHSTGSFHQKAAAKERGITMHHVLIMFIIMVNLPSPAPYIIPKLTGI